MALLELFHEFYEHHHYAPLINNLMTVTSQLALSVFQTASNIPMQLATTDGSADPDFNREIDYIVQRKGYPFEKHNVQTEDGYIIEMHRIPYGRNDQHCARNSSQCSKRPAIFLNPALLASSAMYLWDPPDKSLGLILADSGYDVWIANYRGNFYGKRHVKMSPKNPKFWDFSFHEYSTGDIPAQLDYVIQKTSQPKLYFLGMSQGTLTFFTMLSMKPQYNEKIRVFVGLGPFRKLAHFKVGLLNLIQPLWQPVLNTADEINMKEILPRRTSVRLINALCVGPLRPICASVGDLVNVGSVYLNSSRINVYLQHIPSGTSIKNVLHYTHLVRSKRAVMYDYGTTENMRRYGQTIPPEYSVANIKTPLALYYSDGDNFVSLADVQELINDLRPYVVHTYHIRDPLFSHTNLIASVNSGAMYKDIVNFFKKY